MDNRNSFPHPLCAEKEKEYLAKYKAGDLEAREVLVKHNLRLVAHIAKKYANYPDQDELISIGSLGLIKALTTFSGDKGTQFATYASRCIENEILMAMRQQKKLQNVTSLNVKIGSDKDGNELTYSDILAVDGEDIYKSMEDATLKESLVRLMCETLVGREKEIIALRYGMVGGRFFTQQEISKYLGISRSYVSRIETRALNTMKEAIIKKKLELE